MGEIADMIINGELDEETGEYLGDENMALFGTESPGFPRRKGHISSLDDAQETESVLLPVGVKAVCPECGKRVKAIGLLQHIQMVHDKHH